MTVNTTTLNVDDCPTITSILDKLLISDSYSSIIAVNGYDALEKVQEDQPDFILFKT